MKRVFSFLLILLMITIPASASSRDKIIDEYNIYAAVFGAPEIESVVKADDRFIQCKLENGAPLTFSADHTYINLTMPVSDCDQFLRASISAIVCLSESKSYVDMIGKVTYAYLFAKGDQNYAGGFFLRIEITPAGEYLLSAIKR